MCGPHYRCASGPATPKAELHHKAKAAQPPPTASSFASIGRGVKADVGASASYGKMILNLIWAKGYKVIAVPWPRACRSLPASQSPLQ